MLNLKIKMTKCKPGTTIIDALTLCYVAEGALLNELREITESISYDKYIFYRVRGNAFNRQFAIYNAVTNDNIAVLSFDRYGDDEESYYVWLRISNHILYNSDLLIDTLTIPVLLGLSFNNFTRLDLARDFGYDISQRVRALMRNSELDTIYNGKVVKDRRKLIKGIYRTCSITLDRDGKKGIVLKQSKAVKNKYEGVIVAGYDKIEEIEGNKQNEIGLPEKSYIKNLYGNPKRLHRLEVRLNNPDIRRVCSALQIKIEEDIIFNESILDRIYIKGLWSVLRFRKGCRVIDWDDIFAYNGRYR